jgi:Cu2+-exporting ATPase
MDHKNQSDKNQHQEHHHHIEHSPDQHADHNSSKEHHNNHVDHSGHEQMFRKRFWWSLFLSIPVLIFSPMIQQFLNFTAPDFPGSIWIPFVFSLIIFGYGGIPFLKMAIPEIQNRKPGMMTLISLAISVAFVYSLFAQLTNLGEGFFWELVTLIDIMRLGHWLEMRAVRQASGALNELAK